MPAPMELQGKITGQGKSGGESLIRLFSTAGGWGNTHLNGCWVKEFPAGWKLSGVFQFLLLHIIEERLQQLRRFSGRVDLELDAHGAGTGMARNGGA